MNVSVDYSEISDWINRKFSVTISFKRVDKNTFETSYKPGNFIPTVHVNFKVENLKKDIICISYDCSILVSLFIFGAINHLQNKIPKGIEIKSDERLINIYPKQIDRMQKLMEQVFVSDISFNEKNVDLFLDWL